MGLLARIFRKPITSRDVAWKDEQLRTLFNRIIELTEAATTNRDMVDATAMLEQLGDELKNHFAKEEDTFDRRTRKGARHMAEHGKIILCLSAIKKEMASHDWTAAIELREKFAASLFEHAKSEEKAFNMRRLMNRNPRAAHAVTTG